MADHPYRNTNVIVRDPRAPWDENDLVPDNAHPPNGRRVGDPVGPCVAYIIDMLEDIWNAPFGRAFFTELTTDGKRVVVQFNGHNVPNENSCRGGGDSIAVRMRQLYNQADYVTFGAELSYTLQRARATNPAHDLAWVATQVLTTPLYRWDIADNVPNSPFNPRGVLPAAPAFAGIRDLLTTQITQIITGRLPITGSELHQELVDLLVLVLRPYLRLGRGTSSSVMFNPLKTHSNAVYRPPQVTIMHELTHAYYNITGSQLSPEDSTTERIGRYFEQASVGLPPFDNAPYSENRMRAAMGHPLRTRY